MHLNIMRNQILLIIKNLIARQTSIMEILKMLIQILFSIIIRLPITMRTDMMLGRVGNMLLQAAHMREMPVASPTVRVVMLCENVLVQRCIITKVALAGSAVAAV
jgi:hypothetical protein